MRDAVSRVSGILVVHYAQCGVSGRFFPVAENKSLPAALERSPEHLLLRGKWTIYRRHSVRVV